MAGIGEALRDARERRGLSITQVSQDTRISAHFLEALEAEAFEELSAPVYVRGFLRSYANYLHLDSQALIDELNAGLGTPVAGPEAFIPAPNADPRDPFAPGMAGPPAGRARAGRAEHSPFPAPVGMPVARGRQRGDGLAAGGEGALGEGTTGLRVVAILGAVAMGLLVLSMTAMALRGGDGSPEPAGLDDDDGPRATQTVITVGARTATPSGDGTPGASGTPTVGGSETPEVDETAAEGTPGATAGPGTPTATTVATATSPAVPTATPRPPTATPVPPTATPVPPTPTPIVHPTGFQECPGGWDGYCGGLDYHVVCGPNGWFLDYGRDFANPAGWRVVVIDAERWGQVAGGGTAAFLSACG